jgi:hypothetical protein
MRTTKSKVSKRAIPEFPDLLLCLGWVSKVGGDEEKHSAYLKDESTGEGVRIPYAQAVALMKTRPLQFIRRISVASVQEWVYRMVSPTRQSVLQEMMTMLRCR